MHKLIERITLGFLENERRVRGLAARTDDGQLDQCSMKKLGAKRRLELVSSPAVPHA